MDSSPSKQEASLCDASSSKRRKLIQKTVVTVKIESDAAKNKSEGPPSDCWSWRKYGQKPIKGSPYPRGYYRCSTSKGCSAKKQVERCRTDASILIITYTSDHNHPGPHLPSITTSKSSQTEETSPALDVITKQSNASSCKQSPKPEEEQAEVKREDHEELKMVDNDFFDELEELPMSSSSFTSLVRGSIFDERVLLLPW